MPNTVKKWCWFTYLFIAFTCLYFAVRLPILTEPLGAEDGLFAELVINRPAGPYYAMVGRIDGEKSYGYISHPAALYETLRFGGWLWQPYLSDSARTDDAVITPRLRVFFSSYLLVFGWILLGLSFLRSDGKWLWPLVILCTVLLSPLAIKVSTRLQTDNSAGVVLCGMAALLFLTAGRSGLNRRLGPLLFLSGGFFAGLGKQEWSFALLAAVGTAALLCVIRQRDRQRETAAVLTWAAAGLAIGNLVSYLWDTANYMLGLRYMVTASNLSEHSPTHWNLVRWLAMFQNRLPLIVICMMLMALLVFYLWRHPSATAKWLTVLYGGFLFAEYMISDYSSETRYFAPALAVLTAAALMIVPASLAGWPRMIVLFTAAITVGSTAVFLGWYQPDRNLALEQLKSGQLRPRRDQVLFVNDGAVWNKPELNYRTDRHDFEKTRKRIFEQYGKDLVYPEAILAQPAITCQ
ncbi:MAG: hypothetical protein LLF76_06955 [Planctomycetaceae bacterium]|nr:hypothetical protein [Planctomycetaceae bacterium]